MKTLLLNLTVHTEPESALVAVQYNRNNGTSLVCSFRAPWTTINMSLQHARNFLHSVQRRDERKSGNEESVGLVSNLKMYAKT